MKHRVVKAMTEPESGPDDLVPALDHQPEDEPAKQSLQQVLLTGDRAIAYQEYAAACRELEGLFTAYNVAKERHQVALAKFTKLAAAG